jgi:hypothetical protein
MWQLADLLWSCAPHGGPEAAIELEHGELVEERLGSLQVCIFVFKRQVIIIGGSIQIKFRIVSRNEKKKDNGEEEEYRLVVARTFGRGVNGVVRHHHLVGGGVDLGPLDVLLVATSRRQT